MTRAPHSHNYTYEAFTTHDMRGRSQNPCEAGPDALLPELPAPRMEQQNCSRVQILENDASAKFSDTKSHMIESISGTACLATIQMPIMMKIVMLMNGITVSGGHGNSFLMGVHTSCRFGSPSEL